MTRPASTVHPRSRPPVNRVSTDPRIRSRRREVSRSGRRKIANRIGIAAVVAGMIWVAFWSPVLGVKNVRVVGARHTPRADVRAAAALTSGDNLLLLSNEEVAKRIEALPWVASARVDRMLPGTVRIKVTERVPAVVVSLEDIPWLVDSEGHVLGRSENDEEKDLPIVAGMQLTSIEPGMVIRSEEVTGALKAFRALPGTIKKRVVGVFAPTRERISLSLRNGTQIRVGSAERLPAKVGVLAALLKRLEREGRTTAYIDVRVPTSPAVSTSPAVVPAGGIADPTSEVVVPDPVEEGAEASTEQDAANLPADRLNKKGEKKRERKRARAEVSGPPSDSPQ